MSNYQDKDFKAVYEEILEDVKSISTKWDPSVSDESDPGVAILKAFGLFVDKLNYKINYRNSQNSVEKVTDQKEGERLFSELGYQMKKKRSSSGQLRVKNIGDSVLVLPLFTEFTNQSGSITFTSVRAYSEISVGGTKLIEVQEGSPLQYTYEGQEVFTPENLTTNLRLPVVGLEEIADNGIIIATDNGDFPVASDWLNVSDNFFNSVETKNLFSIGRDYEGNPYIQFYEESLEGLSKGIKIWVISSSGNAGNISANKITRISSTLEEGDSSMVSITHNKFTNGSDEESLSSAMKNYYETYGVNETIISERDYQVAIEKQLGPDLIPITSKVLVTGVDGGHNFIEILTTLGSGKNTILTKAISNPLVAKIFVNALKYSNDYYESFDYLKTNEAERLIKKALFNQKVSSNNLILVDRSEDQDSVYDKFIYDIIVPEGVVYVGSAYSIDETKTEVIRVLKEAFNSRNLTAGEMISEESLSKIIKEKVPGVTGASFYYKERNISTTVSEIDKKDNTRKIVKTDLTKLEKRDLIFRLILSGNLYPFEEEKLQILPFGGDNNGVTYFPRDPSTGKPTSGVISEISGVFTPGEGASGFHLGENEILQLYKKAYDEDVAYGYGVKYRLLAPQFKLKAEKTITGETILLAGSIIAKGSKIKKEDLATQVIDQYTDGNDIAQFKAEYVVQSKITLTSDSSGKYLLTTGTIFSDGSTLDGEKVYGLTVNNDEEVDLVKSNAVLLLQPETNGQIIKIGEGVKEAIIKVSGFETGLKSSGPTDNNLGNIGDSRLDASKTIKTMVPSAYKLNSKFLYGISISQSNSGSKNKFVLTGESKDVPGTYMLEEGEFLVYSDDKLLDFVSLGSGTLIEGPNGLSLDNLIDLDSDFSEKLKPITSDITIYNTEIETFTEGTEVNLNGNSVSSSWASISDSGILIDKIEKDSRYRHRESILIMTDDAGVFKLNSNQELTFELTSGDKETIRGEKLISFSKPVYLNSANESDLSALGLQVAYYSFATNSNGVECQYNDNLFTVSVSPGPTLKEVDIPLQDGWYLIEIDAKLEDGVKFSFSLIDSANRDITGYEANKVIFLNSNSTDLGSGTHQLLIRKSSDDLSQRKGDKLRFVFTGSITTSELNKITLKRFKQIKGLSKTLISDTDFDLSWIIENKNTSDSIPYSTFEDNDGKEFLTNLIEMVTKINGESLSDPDIIKFDYFYETDSPLTYPLEPLKFYNSEHPMNRNILTVIDFDRLEDEEENLIRVIRGS